MSLCPHLVLYVALHTVGARAEIRDIPLQTTGVNRYSAPVTFSVSESRMFLLDTGAAYSVVPTPLIDDLRKAGQAESQGHDRVRTTDGRIFTLEKFLLRSMTVAGCRLENELVYASSAKHGILGMRTLTRLSPITLDIAARTLSLNCLTQAR